MVHSAKQTLARWATGIPSGDPAQVVVVSATEQAARARAAGLATADATVLAPTDGDGVSWHYDGGVVEPYAEVVVDDSFVLQVVPYALGRYTPIGGPTLLRVTEVSDLEAYLADADDAVASGTFSALVAGPSTLLADEPALGGWSGDGGPEQRLWVAADGAVSTGPWGARLGDVDSSLEEVTLAWQAAQEGRVPCAVALSAAVADDVRDAALRARPWLGRYLRAVGALRGLAGRGRDGVRVSGFGGHLDPALDGAADATADDAPVLCWDEDQAYLSNGAARRTVQISHELATVVEKLMVLGPEASEAVPATEAERVSAYFAQAGFRLGTSSSRPTVTVGG
ncbi:hypothetical protein SAMN05216184_11081 [Georgenia satyanarayanai]|uniref:Uncharacterized protein n=1 Tax=Georgenia satyanarayanai TaxID=860221 RepID=A0A2Y9AKD0_9MICO|nr:daptide biosynthesis RiPP recognition protein [Georgenia satyanarayanai]PYF98942.1 hypothetical protein A8987_11081 [Georgenia satyanarayanai]SSA44790.1 hypothetical protein SAMN05216184_11081 [Georgenia satyanarayanai]